MNNQQKMKIGISSPIDIMELKEWLYNEYSDYFTLGIGGSAVTKIVKGFLKQNYIVSVYTLDWKIEQPVILKGDNLTIYIGKMRELYRFHKFKLLDFQYFEAKQIKEFICFDKPDIVNAHWSYEYAIGSILSGKPHLITIRDNATKVFQITKEPYRLIRWFMDKWVKYNGVNFSVNSQYLQSSFRKWKENITIIPNPIEIEFAGIPKKLPTDFVKIVSVLNFGGIKNPESALYAFKIFKKKFPFSSFTLIGPGYEANSKIAQWAIENNLNEGVIFKGWIQHTELLKEMKTHDILLHPSTEESFGNTLIEAMLLGLPVVAGINSGAVKWVLNNGKNGELTDVTNPEQISDSLLKLINNKIYYENLSSSGIEYVKNNFGLTKICGIYLDKYENILSSNKYS